jgi:hypothetical protein
LARKTSAKSADVATQRISKVAIAFANGGLAYPLDRRFAKEKGRLLALAGKLRNARAAYIAIQSREPAIFQQILANAVPPRMVRINPPQLLASWAERIDSFARELKPRSGSVSDSEVYEYFHQVALIWKECTGSLPPYKGCKGGKETKLIITLGGLVRASSKAAARQVTPSKFFAAMEQMDSGSGVAITG